MPRHRSKKHYVRLAHFFDVANLFIRTPRWIFTSLSFSHWRELQISRPWIAASEAACQQLFLGRCCAQQLPGGDACGIPRHSNRDTRSISDFAPGREEETPVGSETLHIDIDSGERSKPKMIGLLIGSHSSERHSSERSSPHPADLRVVSFELRDEKQRRRRCWRR